QTCALPILALESILDGSYRQKFSGNRPEKSQAVDFDHYVDKDKKKNKDGHLGALFEHRRIFIFLIPNQNVPEEISGFIDAEVTLQCTPEALENAVKKYVDKDFYLDSQIDRDLMKVPVSQLMSIFVKAHPLKSCELAYTYLDARSSVTQSRTSCLHSTQAHPLWMTCVASSLQVTGRMSSLLIWLIGRREGFRGRKLIAAF